MNNRTKRLLELMDAEGIETAIITNPKNMYYLSNFYNGEGYVIISRKRLCVVTDFRYTEYAEAECKGFEVCDISGHKPSDFVGDGKVGFEDKSISYSEYQNLKKYIPDLVPLGNMVMSLREVKDEDETSYIRKAVEIADNAFAHICSFIKVGMTEREVAAEIDCYMLKSGADSSAFPTIVAAGERGSLPHAIPSERRLVSGDLVVMDFGCTVKGYCSDMTRTVAVGDISDENMKVYTTVLNAQLEALANVRSGITGKAADAVARTLLDKEYPGAFGHSLGHSVGLDIHESPNLSPRNENEITKGNVVTVEPGVYLPGQCGVRIEDLVVVDVAGCEILTKSPKELVFVG